jgi:REP element-mobilizing transposase RayT
MKYHPNDSVLFVTFSVEEGLLLLSNPLCLAIIRSCLAAAQKLYPVRICHLLVEATHVHLIVVVHNPEDVQAFLRHFKTESAHALNSLLGRNKRTVWCAGYDSPIVLTMTKTIAVIGYIYSNPAKDNLVGSIEEYPGFSTWKMFQKGELTKLWKRIRRPQYRALTPDSHTLTGYTREAERLLKESQDVEPFVLEPNAWLEAFGVKEPEQQEKINSRVIRLVRYLELRAERKRQRQRKRVIGRERLIHEKLDLTYRPDRKGRKTWCLSDDRTARIEYIRFFKKLKQEARRVLALWRMGDTSAKYPPGLYPPSMPKLANVFIAA